MGQMKRFAQSVSENLGYGGEINDTVIEEARLRLEFLKPQAGICSECGKEIDVTGRAPLREDEKWICGNCIYLDHFGW